MRPTKPDDPKRSALMSRVRQKGTAPELIIAAELRRRGAHYRLNVRLLPGSPDFSNRKRRWAVFVNGCFWHHHKGCPRATIPKRNNEFWKDKFRANRTRDARAIRELRRRGFSVVLVWECETKSTGRIRDKLSKIFEAGRIYMCEAIDH
ncbi:MAG: very short patch repair endonuclease [Methylovirgula sp.]